MITVYWIVGMITVYWITGITTVYWLSGKIISWWKHFLTSTRNYFVRSRSCWDLSTILNTGVRRGDWLQGCIVLYRNQALWLFSLEDLCLLDLSEDHCLPDHWNDQYLHDHWDGHCLLDHWNDHCLLALGKDHLVVEAFLDYYQKLFTRSGSCWDLSRILNVCVANWLQGRAAVYRNQALWIYSWEDRSVLDLWADYC